ncbi:YoaK family protein [Neptunomonas phycophila]|uniref:YoaK family protein n=1 Tax=Neptunomonas phycophila TaxID=1572645 RepID=UPI001FEFD88E|nr:YoaK family protein [Neptunomonas phycophila]
MMVSKLPRWVEYGAFILALIAGCVNAIGLLGFEHQSVSHLSGTATLLGTSLVNTSFTAALHLLMILVCFFLGASLSGFLLHGSALKLGRHYDTALLIEAVLLLGAIFLLSHELSYGHFLASAACGLQNALATTYSGAVVRTTHVTGIFTDLGIMVGEKLRGERFDKRKAILFLLIITGFIVGGVVGALLFAMWRFYALLVPAVICLMLSVWYRIYSYQALRSERADGH